MGLDITWSLELVIKPFVPSWRIEKCSRNRYLENWGIKCVGTGMDFGTCS